MPVDRSKCARGIASAAGAVIVVGGAVAGVIALVAPSERARATRAASPVVLDRAVLAFEEDHAAGRVVAEVDAVLERSATGTRLRLVVSAVGPRVEGAVGAEGVAGGNAVSAEELDALLVRGALELRDARGERSEGSVVRASRTGRVVVRRFDPDGRVTHEPGGGRDLALAATLDSGALADGVHDWVVVADGRVRVRATVEVGARARILRLAQARAHDDGAKP